jgi:hypothetical protein
MKPIMTRKANGMPMTKGGYCFKCQSYTTALYDVQVSRQTHSEPAEWEQWCGDCCPSHPEHDEERASLRGYSDEDLERI